MSMSYVGVWKKQLCDNTYIHLRFLLHFSVQLINPAETFGDIVIDYS